MMRSSKRRSLKKWEQDMALQRISILFKLAHLCHSNRPDRSRRYMKLALAIAMRYRVRLPAELKKRVCKTCNTYLMPSNTVRIRLRNGYLVYTCLECGREKRYPYKRISWRSDNK
ncbi:MAG: ribonuclease P protein subunit RPR2 [Candidatus Argoarchaeum ethanivorans]|uniref:Ribonuclease P protein component 4 n=1 Tax=Candidatus Argoarchaeum ethanivorans TaxID=2608793 RepID=A0A8B3RZX4_9EURY|nr:MAG: ribonuclease P protein subunit RPR2 [Candidatus Argoarchaeum ethanivorans]